MPQTSGQSETAIASSPLSLALASSVLILMILVSVFAAPLSRAFALATSHRPETFTTLYFNTSKQSPLPASAPFGKTKTFSFHIDNHEARQMSYTYHVSLKIGTTDTAVRTATIQLPDNTGTDVSVPFSMPVESATGEIIVSLDQPAEHISFRTES